MADVVPNAVIEGVKTHGLGEIVSPPLIRMFNPDGTDLIPNSTTGTLEVRDEVLDSYRYSEY